MKQVISSVLMLIFVDY